MGHICEECGSKMKLFDELKTEIDGEMYQFWTCKCGNVHGEVVKVNIDKLIYNRS